MSSPRQGDPLVSTATGSRIRPTAVAPVRDRLLNAATRLFYRRGIKSVGIDALLHEADAPRMSLYRHFGSKDTLVAACLERLDHRYHDWFVHQIQRRSATPAERLLSIFDVLDEWFASTDFRGCAFINASVELADPHHPGQAAVLNHKRRDRDYVERLARELGTRDPELLARQFMLLMEGAIITALVQAEPNAATDAKMIAETLLPPQGL